MARNPTYYDGDLAADLLRESVRVIEADGVPAVSLRAIGRTLGVSNAAPKNHFPNKAALFAAIAAEGFTALADAVRQAAVPPHDAAVDPGGDTDASHDGEPPIVAAGIAYVDFALGHPGHFAVMWDPSLHGDPPEVLAAKADSFASLLGLIGDASDDAAVDLANLAWALAHGLATLLLSNSLDVPRGLDREAYVRLQLRSLYDLTPQWVAPR